MFRPRLMMLTAAALALSLGRAVADPPAAGSPPPAPSALLSGPESGPISGPTSGPISGPTSGPISGPISGPASATPAAKDAGPLALIQDETARLTIPVMIDGQGPYRFIIDTGADRTVISGELAAELNLPTGPIVLVHNSGGADAVGTVRIKALSVGPRTVNGIEAPVLTRANLGAVGMLGLDTLRDQKVVMDFVAKTLQSVSSRNADFDGGIVVRGKSRFGQLVLVDSEVRGVPVMVILDSGAQNSIGNRALQKILARGDPKEGPNVGRAISVTGRETPVDIRMISEVRVGALSIHNMPLAFADLQTFTRFGLADRPAMLLGMDVLSLCRTVTVDFKRREASFRLLD